ncbi:MAG: heparinase II/III-family protein, partial [Lentisphaeria bacterium]|nr:heparinase II/III-family protein [Lentisphaeria bacterium]NQZ70647.1 heparinase II/III-family protein [Lentisphaeria bacterium]
MDYKQIKQTLETCELVAPATRPGLLFSSSQTNAIRLRTQNIRVNGESGEEALLDQIRRNAEKIMAEPAFELSQENVMTHAHAFDTVADAAFLLDEDEWHGWAKKEMKRFYTVESWRFPLHSDGGYGNGPDSLADHVMTNIAASMAWAHELGGDTFSESETADLAAAVYNRCLAQFHFSMRDRKAWWSQADKETNWKIMCAGEAGFATCAFFEHYSDSRELLWYAARGVLETLDQVSAEGDWYEGISYWYTTLYMGLRFALALRNITQGEVDLFQHDALKRTGDFALMASTPGGTTYNFNDNHADLPPFSAQAILLIAQETGRFDWLKTARQFASNNTTWLALENPDLPETVPVKTNVFFQTTGIATMRSDWESDASFVGFKAGKSQVSHGHLDANSFVFEAGGKQLLIDEGTWPYAGQIGFHEFDGPRWNFDALATIGHNSILVDGQGQASEEDLEATILSVDGEANWQRIVGDAAAVYPGLLSKFIRTIILVDRDILVVHDSIICDGERHVEWLMHYAGDVKSEGPQSIITNGDTSLVVTPLLPDRINGWRVTDATRTSTYHCHDVMREVNPSIRYRSFSPFRKAGEFEFLFAMRVNGDPLGSEWDFTCD